MISDIKSLTSDSVIPYLQGLGKDPNIYSNFCKGMEPLLCNYDVYLYIEINEVVVVVLDPRPKLVSELADEEPFNGEHPLWFSESSHRESPVWKLAVTCDMICERLKRLGQSKPHVWGVLLTSCEVINYSDMVEVWNTLRVSVCHRMMGLHNLSLAVNPHIEMPISLPMPMIWDAKYSLANIKESETALGRLMEEGKEQAKEPQQLQLFNFDDDDFDFEDDYDMNDAVPDSQLGGNNAMLLGPAPKIRKNDIMHEVADVSLKIITGEGKLFYSNGKAVVTLTAAKGDYFYLDTYSCSIYTSDLCLMCNSDKAGEENRSRGNLLTLTMPCSEIWLPGNYFMLLSNNDSSFERIDFTLDEQLEATLGERRGCSLLGMEDILLTYIDKYETCWKQLTDQPGTVQFRQFVIKRIQIEVYNGYRNSLKGRSISSCVNLQICKRNNDIDEQFLYNLYKLSMIEKRQFMYVDCSQLYDASRSNPYENMNEVLHYVNKRVICLDGIGMLLCAGGKLIVKRVLELMRAKGDENTLWLCGTRQEIDALISLYPSLNSFFLRDSRLEQQPYSPFELVQSFRNYLFEEFVAISPEVKDALSRAILKGNKNCGMSAWTLESIHRFVDEEVCPRYLTHAFSTFLCEDLAELSEDDLCLEKLSGCVSSFDESMRELNQMVGLGSVKKNICTMANKARFYVERKRRHLKVSDKMVFHSIFTGNPGTGKTTVARMLGRIYNSLGILSKGEVVEVDRARLVGRYIGETEENVKMLLEEARGNVLFVDEAYTLCTGVDDQRDFGLRVIDSLMTVLSQPDPDMVIVFAGYPKEMERLLATNPGLSSRFGYRYHFDDYNAEQLLQIARHILEHDDYILTDEATVAMQNIIEKALKNHSKDFGNARWVTQLVDGGIIPALAERVFSTGSDDFQHVEAADIRVAYEMNAPKTDEQDTGPKKVIGFCA